MTVICDNLGILFGTIVFYELPVFDIGDMTREHHCYLIDILLPVKRISIR